MFSSCCLAPEQLCLSSVLPCDASQTHAAGISSPLAFTGSHVHQHQCLCSSLPQVPAPAVTNTAPVSFRTEAHSDPACFSVHVPSHGSISHARVRTEHRSVRMQSVCYVTHSSEQCGEQSPSSHVPQTEGVRHTGGPEYKPLGLLPSLLVRGGVEGREAIVTSAWSQRVL